MQRIRIGVLGCADVAKRLIIPNMIESGLFYIAAISSRSDLKAREFASQFNCDAIVGYENLLKKEDIDAIYIPLPNGLHYEWILKALNYGKHLFVEKSFTCNYDETKKSIELAKEKNLCLFENFMFPYHSQIDFVNERVNNDEIGDIKLLRSSFGFPIFNKETNIRYKKELGGGALLDAGAYTVKAAQLMLGLDQTVVASSLFNDGWDVDFHGSVMLENSQNIVSQLAFGFNNFYQNNIELWGSKGKIIIERAFTAGPSFSPKIKVEKQNIINEYTLQPDNHFYKILTKFYNAIKEQDFIHYYNEILNQSRLITDIQQFSKKRI